MADHHPSIRSLILLGGESSRMGSPKHLLQMPSAMSETGCDSPLLVHLLCIHHIFQVKHGDPILRTVTLSVRDDEQRNDIKDLLTRYESELPGDLNISYVQDGHTDHGPGAGLIAAWRLDEYAHWLVTGCNYPMISKTALETLRTQHHLARKAVTCFTNSDGHPEVLLALWTGTALERLRGVIEQQESFDPSHVLTLLEQEETAGTAEDQPLKEYSSGVQKLRPADERWTTNVDNPEEWSRTERYLKGQFDENDA